MTYYILPQIEYHIRDANIKIAFDNKKQSKIYSLQKYLSKIKSLIDKHITDWDSIKKYTNPYEFVHFLDVLGINEMVGLTGCYEIAYMLDKELE